MKIAILVSGGVDSAVALKLLKDQGHNLTAFYLKIWLEDELSSKSFCPWQEDLDYVRKTCDQLNIPLEIISFQEEYYKKVVSYTIKSVQDGFTPNPDVLCNQHIKFGIFYDKISQDFEKVATGHYAQILENKKEFLLKRSPDSIKDQTYFLSNLSQTQLSRAIFPIGHMTKQEIRALAKNFDLPSAERKDSQGICFLGKFKFSEFIEKHLGKKSGEIKEFETETILGIHDGHWFYTIGQRHGIKLSDGPWYVVSKNSEKNIVYVSNKYESIDELRQSFKVINFNWLSTARPDKNLLVKVRHRSLPQKCFLNFENDNEAIVTLEKKDQGIAPGQFAVFYDNDICLGSATMIEF